MSDHPDNASELGEGGNEIQAPWGEVLEGVERALPAVVVEPMAPALEMPPEVAWFDRVTAWVWDKVIETFYNSLVLVLRVLLQQHSQHQGLESSMHSVFHSAFEQPIYRNVQNLAVEPASFLSTSSHLALMECMREMNSFMESYIQWKCQQKLSNDSLKTAFVKAESFRRAYDKLCRMKTNEDAQSLPGWTLPPKQSTIIVTTMIGGPMS